MAKGTTNHKAPPNTTGATFTPRPLSTEQLNAIPLLCSGLTDAEVGQAVGVVRETVWSWRHEVPLFMAELEKARQQFISVAIEKLRSTLPKAVENVVAAVEAGHLKASLELLRCTGISGDGTRFAHGETDPSAIALTLCLQRLAKEPIPETTFDVSYLDRNPAYESRKREILDELETS